MAVNLEAAIYLLVLWNDKRSKGVLQKTCQHAGYKKNPQNVLPTGIYQECLGGPRTLQSELLTPTINTNVGVTIENQHINSLYIQCNLPTYQESM